MFVRIVVGQAWAEDVARFVRGLPDTQVDGIDVEGPEARLFVHTPATEALDDMIAEALHMACAPTVELLDEDPDVETYVCDFCREEVFADEIEILHSDQGVLFLCYFCKVGEALS